MRPLYCPFRHSGYRLPFSTIQGSGGAPDSFVGTSGVDSIAFTTQQNPFFLGAQEANDNISFVAPGIAANSVQASTLRGGAGNDAFIATGATTTFSSVFFNGNSGVDTFNFTGTNLLSNSTVQGGQGGDNINTGANSFSLINGNRNNDTIIVDGVAISSSIFGGQGTDTITISAATTNSSVAGADGADTINSTVGALTGSTLTGGAGNDSINIAAAGSGAVIDAGDDNDTVTGNAAADTIDAGAGNDNVRAGAGNDNVTLGAGNDTVDGQGGNDNITGGDGADTITGGAGNDTMNGGDGVNQFGNANNFGAANTSTVASATALAAGAVVAGNTLTFGNGVDLITGFQTTDTLDVVTAGVAPTLLNGTGNAATFAAGTTYVAYGTWNAATRTFTVGATPAAWSATSTDAVVIVGDANAAGAQGGTGYQVLSGLGATIANAQFV